MDENDHFRLSKGGGSLDYIDKEVDKLRKLNLGSFIHFLIPAGMSVLFILGVLVCMLADTLRNVTFLGTFKKDAA